jgi:hypothetical protein
MPILSLMYLLSFMDRGDLLFNKQSWGTDTSQGNIGNAKIEGLTTQLKLVGNQYNIALVCVTRLVQQSNVLRGCEDNVFYSKYGGYPRYGLCD